MKIRIYLKVYNKGNEILVAACDEEILGKRFSEGKVQLDVSREFYFGELRDINELSNALDNATIANLAGNNTVNFAIEQGSIDKENVLEIAGIKHAQIIIIP